MPVASFTAPALLDALKTGLDARSAISDDDSVNVFTGPPDPGTPYGTKAIVFVRVNGRTEWALIGDPENPTNDDRYTVEGVVSGTSPQKGEDGIKEARDNAAEMLEELHNLIRSDLTVSGTVKWARVAAVDWDQGLGEKGRRCTATFQIDVRARI